METITRLKALHIPVNFSFNGIDYNFTLHTENEGSDFWTCFYGEDGRTNDVDYCDSGINFDVHYSEEYNEICIYEIYIGTLETNYNETIHKQPIY